MLPRSLAAPLSSLARSSVPRSASRGVTAGLARSAAVRSLVSSSPSRADLDAMLVKPKAKEPASLAQIIDDSIGATGPMPVARYMQLCLTHPTLGYYTQGDVFGQKGDFITSPEISQIFGELLAIWFLTRWMAAGAPAKVRLVELGPGRGTLMDDVLRRTYKKTLQALGGGKLSVESVVLVEASEKMREIQKAKLSDRITALGGSLSWESDVEQIPESETFTMLLAHEFFDALPIHILQRSQDGFREVRVARNPSYLPVANNARFSLAVDREQSLLSQLLPAASKRFSALPTGSQMEISPDSSRIVRSAARLMKAGGGAALVVDYGDDRVFANSFRAFREHKIVNIFDKPGSSDLTANVDFAYLRESLEDIATAFGPVPQGKFLLSMGLEPRLEKLVAAATDAETTERIRKGAKRLIDTTGMGSQYQVMGFGVGPASEGEVYPFPPPKPAPAPPTPAPASSPADSTPRAGGAPTSGSKL